MSTGTPSEPQLRLTDILTRGRVQVDVDGTLLPDKAAVLRRLADLLGPAVGVDTEVVERLLVERERLQSTGIGDGVAIPHTSVDTATVQAAALLVCPRGVPFEAIDGTDVTIVFGVVGPRRATGEHLRILARISRLLRDDAGRQRLVSAPDPDAAFSLIEGQDSALR